MGDSIKGFAEVQVENIHSLFLTHQASHLLIKGDQVSQAGPAFPKPVLAGTDPLVVLYVLCDCTPDLLFLNFVGH